LHNNNNGDIFEKLKIIYKKYVPRGKPIEISEMACMWSINNPPDLLEYRKQLEEIERKFNIYIDEENAQKFYEMTLIEASEYIKRLIINEEINN
jgi:hypothetical protein